MKGNLDNQKGIIRTVPLLVVIAAVGVISFLLISSTAPLSSGLLSKIFNKPSSHAAQSVGRYDVLELPFNYSSTGLSNPWEQVKVTAVFTTPSGKTITWLGFYYDTNDYRIRFAPAEIGNYTYTVNITGGPSGPFNTSGSFSSIASANKGFLRQSTVNPYRLMFESDHSIASLVGLQTSWDTNPNPNNPALGPMYSFLGPGSTCGGAACNLVDYQTFFQRFGNGEGKYNLFRTNGNPPVYASIGSPAPNGPGTTYNIANAKYLDNLVTAAHANGFHIQYLFFHGGESSGQTPPTSLPNSTSNIIDYGIARYGAYTDIWELYNETDYNSTSQSWLTYWRNYVHNTADPYHRMVTNSSILAQDWTYLDVRSPHSNPASGAVSAMNLWTNNFTTGKPVVVGEAYNGGNVCNVGRGEWLGFILGLTRIYWAENWMACNATGTINVSIGQADRNYTSVLASVANTGFDDTSVSSKPTSVWNPSLPAWGDGTYALASSKKVLIYGNTNDGGTFTDTVTFNFPFAGSGIWIDPKTGNTLKTQTINGGTQTIASPSFVGEIAFVVTNPAISSPTPGPSAVPSITPQPTPTRTPAPTPTPTPSPVGTSCTLSSPSWGISTVSSGTRAPLSINATGNCTGVNVSFNVLRDNFPQNNIPATIQPANTTVSGGVAASSWVAEGVGNYFFTARIVGGSSISNQSAEIVVTAANSTPTPAPTSNPCPKGLLGDANCDGAIDIFDYSAVITHFNQSGTNIAGDVNKDGVVDIFDYSLVVTHFGQ